MTRIKNAIAVSSSESTLYPPETIMSSPNLMLLYFLNTTQPVNYSIREYNSLIDQATDAAYDQVVHITLYAL